MFKVVVIDDEVLVRHGIVLETDWNSLGCIVVAEAGNGLEGIEAVHKYRPDLLICDIRMPKMDAQSACKLLASDYLLKPFQDGELESAVLRVTEHIREKQGRRREKEETAPLILSSGDKSKYVMEAINFISEHYQDTDISVGVIAQSLGISEGHLSHTFKKETDYTVMAYITRIRMSAAMKLLADCRNKVYEVAEAVGYRDIAYFSSSFKKIVGVSPSEYQDRSI